MDWQPSRSRALYYGGESLVGSGHDVDYTAYMPIILLCISFMFIEMKFIHYHSCVMFSMKSMSICNDSMNYDEIIIQ